jgi:tRNA 2-thiouridine synthesizing protein E
MHQLRRQMDIKTVRFQGKDYQICGEGFLSNPKQWDEAFAEGMARTIGLRGGLSDEHWAVIRYIQKTFKRTGRCPSVYETCHVNNLFLSDLQRLFPTGYQRGPCRLAGITYREGFLQEKQKQRSAKRQTADLPTRVYRVDVYGFLVDHEEWDEEFAVAKAAELKIPGRLTDRHWDIIRFLRDSFTVNGTVPTVYETCQSNALDIAELERLFPDGYHRGAVKIAGLRL